MPQLLKICCHLLPVPAGIWVIIELAVQFGHYGHACYGGEGDSLFELGGRVEGQGWAGMHTPSLSTGQLGLQARLLPMQWAGATTCPELSSQVPSALGSQGSTPPFRVACPQAAAPPSPTCWSSLWAASPLVGCCRWLWGDPSCLSAVQPLALDHAFCLLSRPCVFPTPHLC